MKAFYLITLALVVGTFLYVLLNPKGRECLDLGGVPTINSCYKVDIEKIEME